MPYLGRCANCGWVCLGERSETKDDVLARIREHSKGRHIAFLYAVTSINEKEWVFLKNQWYSSKFWARARSGRLRYSYAKREEAGSRSRFLGVPCGRKGVGIGTRRVAAGLRVRTPKPERMRASELNEQVSADRIKRTVYELHRSILASQKRSHTIREPSDDLNDAVIEQLSQCARLMDKSRLMENIRGDFKPGIPCVFCGKPIETEEDSLKSDPSYTDRIGWVHRLCLLRRGDKPASSRVRISSQPRPKYLPKLPSENPKKMGEYRRKQRGE
jgi:hypothetical protein